jgi:hypothetical protein
MYFQVPLKARKAVLLLRRTFLYDVGYFADAIIPPMYAHILKMFGIVNLRTFLLHLSNSKQTSANIHEGRAIVRRLVARFTTSAVRVPSQVRWAL